MSLLSFLAYCVIAMRNMQWASRYAAYSSTTWTILNLVQAIYNDQDEAICSELLVALADHFQNNAH
ncbi:hypothetical protein J26TS2_07710 [Shouchella clausii]|nr:hypothetical protein J26TS2_07710 [Shouchella clausii]